MLSREKLEYQKRLRFLREAKAKTASEKLKLATKAEESDLTKRVETLGDEENRVPSRGETPKEYNEVPKTRETSRVKKPLEDGNKGDNILDVDLSDIEYAKIAEGTQREEDAKQSLERHKKTIKQKRDITDVRSFAQRTQQENKHLSLTSVLKECACQEKNPFDAPEEEHQGYMLVQSLDKLADQADELSGMAHHEDNPEPWVEFKVNAAAEQLDAVHDYITYGRKHRPDMEHHMGSEHIEELYENIKKIIRDEIKKILKEERTFESTQQLVDFLLLPNVQNGPTAHINWLATRPSNEQITNTRRYVGAAINIRIPQLKEMQDVKGNSQAESIISQIADKFDKVLEELPQTVPAAQERNTFISNLQNAVVGLRQLRDSLLLAIKNRPGKLPSASTAAKPPQASSPSAAQTAATQSVSTPQIAGTTYSGTQREVSGQATATAAPQQTNLLSRVFGTPAGTNIPGLTR